MHARFSVAAGAEDSAFDVMSSVDCRNEPSHAAAIAAPSVPLHHHPFSMVSSGAARGSSIPSLPAGGAAHGLASYRHTLHEHGFSAQRDMLSSSSEGAEFPSSGLALVSEVGPRAHSPRLGGSAGSSSAVPTSSSVGLHAAAPSSESDVSASLQAGAQCSASANACESNGHPRRKRQAAKPRRMAHGHLQLRRASSVIGKAFVAAGAIAGSNGLQGFDEVGQFPFVHPVSTLWCEASAFVLHVEDEVRYACCSIQGQVPICRSSYDDDPAYHQAIRAFGIPVGLMPQPLNLFRDSVKERAYCWLQGPQRANREERAYCSQDFITGRVLHLRRLCSARRVRAASPGQMLAHPLARLHQKLPL